MAQRIVPLRIDDECIKGAGVNLGAAGSHDAVVLELSFSQLWDGLTKSVLWTDAYGIPAGESILSDAAALDDHTYQITVPYQPLRRPGKMSMTIKGVFITDVNGTTIEKIKAVTEAAYFRVMDSLIDAQSQSEFDPSVAEQLQQEIDDNKTITDLHFKDAAYTQDSHSMTFTREDGTTKDVVIVPSELASVYDISTHKYYDLTMDNGRLVLEEV